MLPRRLWAFAGGLALLMAAVEGRAALPEAIVPTNSLPPAAGRYELYPPSARAIWKFDIVFDGTNMPVEFQLQNIKAGTFKNIVCSVSGNDQVIDCDAIMQTRVPVWNIGDYVSPPMALYDQTGHLRLRVVDRALRATGLFSVVVEAFSWMLTGRDDEGNPGAFFHVRLQKAPVSTGWITVTNLPAGGAVMQSEIFLYPEGVWTEVSTNYYPTVSGPLRLVLRGASRTLQILSIERVASEVGERVWLDNSHLGTQYLHGVEYSTNGIYWKAVTTTDIWGRTNEWFDSIESYSYPVSAAPMTSFRLKARLRQ